jgi:hypothetical protein
MGRIQRRLREVRFGIFYGHGGYNSKVTLAPISEGCRACTQFARNTHQGPAETTIA